MTKSALLLHPIDTSCQINHDTLLYSLDSIGLIGEQFDDQQWLVGEQFLQLLTFMGCSPHIRLRPDTENDADYCCISVQQWPSTQLLYSDHSRPCRCRNCGKPIVNRWEEFKVAAQSWNCQHCDTSHERLEALRWRHDSGIGSYFIKIHSIYPGEAQPVTAFINHLEQATSQEWRYFYLHSRHNK